METIVCRGKDKRDGEVMKGNLNIVNDKIYINGFNGDLDDTDYGWGFVEIPPETLEMSFDNEKTWRSVGEIKKILEASDDKHILTDLDYYRKYGRFGRSNMSNIEKETVLEMLIEEETAEVKRLRELLRTSSGEAK